MSALTLMSASASAQVTVNPGGVPYTTLKAAFDAINAGTHTGAIAIDISGNTTETASAVLNASGVGGALYTGVVITPSVPATVSGSIVGAVIKLNGADNVTIDGRIGGVGRNLSVVNNSTATATAAIWLASLGGAGNGASNNIIRSLEIACGADQQALVNSTFGIIQTGTTISVTSTNGDDNDNNRFLFNRIVRVRYGIVSRGVTTNNNLAPIITDNIIGPAAFGPDQIGRAGIYMQADTGAVISRNTIQNVGALIANFGDADRIGIAIGNENWDVTNFTTITSGNYTVTRNVIHDIVDETTFSAVGIRLGTTRSGAATNNLVANNFIYNIRANGTLGDQVAGIGFVAGHTDRIVFNSISLTGDMDPGAADASVFGNAIRVSTANGANNVNLTLMNNSIFLDASSITATVHFYAITLNSSAYVFGAGGLNNNNYFINAANPQLRTGGLAAVSGPAATTEFLTLANWQAALTAPQDANSIQSDPLHFSNTTDLHIQQASPNVDAGTAIAGVVDDIDGQVRPNGPNPDIGADEFFTVNLGVTKSHGGSPAPGQSIVYTITVSNTGNTADPAAAIADRFPAILTCSYTATATGGATGFTAAGVGNINDVVNMPAGSSVTYTATCGIPANTPGGSLSNTATATASAGVTDSDPTNNSATDSYRLVPTADLSITLTDSPDPVQGLGTLTYTVTVTNNGPSDASGISVVHTLPAEATFSSLTALGWSCITGTGTVTCDRASLTLGATASFDVEVTFGPQGATVNSSATVSSASSDLNGANNTDSEQTTVNAVPYADLSVSVNDGGVTALWNRPLTYTITVTNGGPDAVTGASVTDNFPVALENVSWTCSASAGSTCTGSGSGNINDTVNLLSGGTATYTATGTVAYGTVGPLVNTATVNSSIHDPAAANNSSTINTPVDGDLIFMDGFE